MRSSGSSKSKRDDEGYAPGDLVLITSGAFQSFTGSVISVDDDEETLKVLISFMSAWRTVELSFDDVKKTI